VESTPMDNSLLKPYYYAYQDSLEKEE